MQYSIHQLSKTFLHPDFRWDSEFLCFEPYKNKNIKYAPIGDVLLTSQYGISIDMNEEKNGTKIYRMNEISNMLCNREISKYAEINLDEIDIYRLKNKDILFNRTNSQAFVGRTGIFKKFSNEDFVFASYLVRLNSNPDIITPEYLTTFLNTQYGVLDVKRRARISINQSNVNAEELKRVEIPLVNNGLQYLITDLFDKAFEIVQTSEKIYSQAQDLLLAELGLLNWKPRHRLTFIKNYSDTVDAERIDAEYFQPKYEAIIKVIKGYEGGWDTLGDLVKLRDKNYKPSEDQSYKYIELANIQGSGEIADHMEGKGQNLPSRARRKVAKGDVIVSSIEGSLESIAMIEKDYNEALCSNGFHVIYSKKLNSETLLILLKSIVSQLQLKKGCTGTILTAISKDELKKIIIPLLPSKLQTQIQQKVIASHTLRKKAKRLLEIAKQGVEMAIETDEKTAMEWIKEEENKI